jgi:hypothetical protein
MRKLRLDLEAIDVVSFPTDDQPDALRGTVHGRDSTGSHFTVGHVSCYGECMTEEYHTCREAGPSVGPSCDYVCTALSVGCLTEGGTCE